MSRCELVEIYIASLPLTLVAVVSSGRRCEIRTGEIPPGAKIKFQFYFRPTHADLVLMTIGREGLSGTQPAVLAASIERAAAMLGAPVMTLDEVRRVAEQAVDEITERVKLANYDGAMKDINRRFKAYRLAQAAKGEKALPYHAFIEPFVMTIVRSAAASGLAI